MPGALDGVTVLDFSRVLAGPYATMMLADLGATVVKVERAGVGDETRAWGPPYDATGTPTYFTSVNRNKSSIAVDLRDPAHVAALRERVRGADVVIENFRAGTMDRLGLGYDAFRDLRPDLVYCSITGFGQDGPYANLAGYDYIVQGMSGFMSITGEPDGQPMKAGVAIADIFTGIYAVSAIQAALIHAMKTGEGQLVDMALLDVMSAVLANQTMNYLVSGIAPQRLGNAHPNLSPYEVIPVRDGYIILAIGNDGQFRRFCRILGVEELANEDRFATNKARVANRLEVRSLLVAQTIRWTKADLLAACGQHAVPVGPINSIGEMFEDPQIKARELRVDLEAQDATVIPGVRTPIVLSETPLVYHRPSPRLGEHTNEILAELKAMEEE